jgi:hypothetical protein
MKLCMMALGLLLATRTAPAQERIPDEEAKKLSPILVEAAGKARTPLKVEVDPDKPYGKHKDENGALVLPAKDLAAEAIAKAGEEIVPIAQLWMRGLGPVVDNQVVSAKKLLVVPVTFKDKEHNLVLCCLGVQKVKGRPSLVLLSKDRTPLVTVPLEKVDEKQELPIEFAVTIEEERQASVLLTLAGKYRARLKVGVLTD